MAWLLLASLARADDVLPDIVTDPLTGVAMEGYDAVSYFISSEPQQGSPDFEYVWSGVSWYFVSAANRDVFARNPTTYAPQYGGHCVMSLSRGYLSDGKPRLYLIDALRLYFFYSTANRDAFLMSKAEALKLADDNWQNLSKGLPVEKPEESFSSSEASSAAAASEEPAPVEPDAPADNVPAH